MTNILKNIRAEAVRKKKNGVEKGNLISKKEPEKKIENEKEGCI